MALFKFCDFYGFSAQDAYRNASNIDTFEVNLVTSCHHLKYDNLVEIIADVLNLDFCNDVSHTIFCIFPAEVVLKYTFDFMSQHVYNHALKSLWTLQVSSQWGRLALWQVTICLNQLHVRLLAMENI